MANHTTGAQRANARYDKIWDTAQRLSLAQREMNKPKLAPKPQQACDMGLFSDDSKQTDLIHLLQQPE